MDQQYLEQFAQNFVQHSPLNRVVLQKAQREIVLFEAPLLGCASADDALFAVFQQHGVVGPHFRTPDQWLNGAKTVISFFLPFTDAVRESNHLQQTVPGEGWLYGRIEGQQFVSALCDALATQLRSAGYAAIVPSSSPEFHTVSEPDGSGLSFTSNWSERHVAYACGLGTFGLSKGIITARGMAGRFGSIVTNWTGQPTPRAYTQIYEHCIRCGRCAQRCPGGAITLEGGKDHARCLSYQKTFMPQVLPRFGCGLCQTDVPCEKCMPGR